MAEKKQKKRVQVSAPAAGSKGAGTTEPAWKPSAENKAKAKNFRIIAWILWILAIAAEGVIIWWLVGPGVENIWWLILALIPIAAAAIGANLLWKQANRLDPASKKNKTKFFIQNQLGVFMTILAFLPLVIMIFTNDELDGKEKAIAGSIAAGAMVLIAAFTGASWDGGPSVEQYAEEENIMVLLTGEDEVYWVKSGSVFHVCAEVPDVNRESKDGTIYSGTVAAAHEAGKDRLTKRWESEAINHCGYTQEEVDAVKAGLEAEKEGLTQEEAEEVVDEIEENEDEGGADEAETDQE